jgi:hypothetical protein
VVAVVGPLERVLARVGDRTELPAAVWTDDDVGDRVRAHCGRKRPAGPGAGHEHLQPPELDGLPGAERPEQVVRPSSRRQNDAAGRDEAVRCLETDHASSLHAESVHRLAEVRDEPVASRGREPAQAHLLRVGKSSLGLVRCTGDPVRRKLRLDVPDLARFEETRIQPEGLQHADISPTGLRPFLGDRQQVPAADVTGIRDAHLLLPAHDRPRPGDRKPGSDRIRVVAAHHRERPAGIPTAWHSAVEERDRARAVAAQSVGGRQPEDARADDRGVDGLRHARTVPTPCTS